MYIESSLRLFEILVPAQFANKVDEDGFPINIPIEMHRFWDMKVLAITGGLTIRQAAKGLWKSKIGEEVITEEPMIPVRIACTNTQMQEIAQFTKEWYQQEAIMYYKLSDEVFFI